MNQFLSSKTIKNLSFVLVAIGVGVAVHEFLSEHREIERTGLKVLRVRGEIPNVKIPKTILIGDVGSLSSTGSRGGTSANPAKSPNCGLNSMGKPIWTEDSFGKRSQFLYDLEGHLVERISPDGQLTRWEYEPDGTLFREISPSGQIIDHPNAPDAPRCAQ